MSKLLSPLLTLKHFSIIRALSFASRHLSSLELGDLTELDQLSVDNILSDLQNIGVLEVFLEEQGIAKYGLQLSNADVTLLNAQLSNIEQKTNLQRTVKFSERVISRFKWIDEMAELIAIGKRNSSVRTKAA